MYDVLSRSERNAILGNNSICPQASASKQLAVALRRLCTESSIAGSCMNTVQLLGILEGLVVYTKRVLKALMDL